ncbi:hypothetical protein SIN8267_00662 [Sinobacterium norvegicum]|uniref:DUF1415 domain-containing protein n=1 Tax=Sinobacterium norvegicum TaxID=1641715 RepID=A0ABM9AC58_9GAMM|nr:DUF1415 domain-containing protein [Sinobacterium norvegicum]CAH0990569.1 hypothetical protein SIN8267_00662 [Sinobacterium norvegicum]
MQTQKMIEQTSAWVGQFIVKYNICPFARREVEAQSIRYCVATESTPASLLQSLLDECRYLDDQPLTETTLMIIPSGMEGFYDYLDLLSVADQLLLEEGYEGVYQLASFHPDYCFDGVPQDDASNVTNRSPYPMFHIIREASMEKALKNYKEPESIPDNNIRLTREKGSAFWQQLFHSL